MSKLALMKAGTRAHRIVSWPGRGTMVAIRLLTVQEIQLCHIAARARCEQLKTGSRLADLDLIQDEADTQILAVALRDPENIEMPFAASVDELRAALLPDEKEALLEAYVAWYEESHVTPDLSDAAFKELVEEVKKKGEASSSIGMRTLRRLVRTLAVLQ